jgi:hypothetical protein
MAIKLTDINRLMDNARTNLPGSLDGPIQLEFFNVLNDFFQKSNIWVEDITFPVTALSVCGSTVDITPESGAINRLMYVLDADNSQRRMTMAEPGTLLFVDTPNAAATWVARVSKTVIDPIATSGRLAGFPQAPDWILTKYNNGLLSGLLGNMMAQVAKPYTNPKLALMHMRKYSQALANARSEARHQNLYAAQAWRFPVGFANRSHGSNRG